LFELRQRRALVQGRFSGHRQSGDELMTRRIFAFLAAAQARRNQKPGEACPMQIVIDKGDAVTFTLPGLKKEEIVDILGDFLGHGPGAEDQHQQEHIKEVLRRATDLTMVITSKCEKSA
jgi:hypothetical protein